LRREYDQAGQAATFAELSPVLTEGPGAVPYATLAERLGTTEGAARAAARAGCGQGKDEPPPDAAARAELRSRARDWLEADLAQWSEPHEQTTGAIPREVRSQLARWRTDPDLACVRDPEALAKLPDSERESWDSLWAAVGALLANAHPVATP
jgi:hypothetical protein